MMTGRDCSFLSEVAVSDLSQASSLPSSTSSPQPPGQSAASSPDDFVIGNSQHSKDLAATDIAPLTPASLPRGSCPPAQHSQDKEDVLRDDPVNFQHMELLMHLSFDKELFNLGHVNGIGGPSIPLGLKWSLETPYLLYVFLAFSARHLAYRHPDRAASYLHQAVALQTRAITLFNAAWNGTGVTVDSTNCVVVLLFSTVLGHHLLADTLAARDHSQGLVGFISQYVRCLDMHRSIYNIAGSAWPLLMRTEMQPILSWSSGFTSRTPRGDHCRRLLELVDLTHPSSLTEADKELCRKAIRHLQVGFDALLDPVVDHDNSPGNRYQMIFSWTMLLPPEFTALLAAKKPEVLVIMAYYALLMHYGRVMWQVRDAGAYLLGLIVDFLGPRWDYWLEHPKQWVLQ
jgi:hypothetical protein